MQNYIDLIQKTVYYGVDRFDRTGIGSRFLWGAQLEWDLADGFPATVVRPVPIRWAFEEVMMFLRGETQTKTLEEKGITIWKGNTSREFLDKVGLTSLPEGDMGKGYGYQWRNFGGVDQITQLLDDLIREPASRRHIVSAWNPAQIKEAALPPCHVLQHYYIDKDRLNSAFWMRSNDLIYGLPFNIVQYALLNHIFAKYLLLRPGKLVYQCSDAHIYSNQLPMAKHILDNADAASEIKLPELHIQQDLIFFRDIMDLQWSDIEVVGYNPLPDYVDKPPMAV